MTDNAAQHWIAGRFAKQPHLAGALGQQYEDAKDAIDRIGTAALDFPAQKELVLWPMAAGPNGEHPIVWADNGLAPRWGSRRPVWPHMSKIYPTGDPTQPDIPGTVAWIRKALTEVSQHLQAPYVFLDLEGEGFTPVDYVQKEVFPDVIQRTAKLIRDLKAELEDDVKVGIWGHYPLASIHYWNYPDPKVPKWMLTSCREMQPVLKAADWVAPEFYVEPKREGDDYSFTAQQTAHAIEQTITVARSYNPNLLVTPCLMTDRYKTWQEQEAPDSPEKTLARAMPADYFQTILEPCFALGDGVMLWQQPLKNSPPPVFTWDLPWIPVLEEYLVRYGVMPWSAITK